MRLEALPLSTKVADSAFKNYLYKMWFEFGRKVGTGSKIFAQPWSWSPMMGCKEQQWKPRERASGFFGTLGDRSSPCANAAAMLVMRWSLCKVCDAFSLYLLQPLSKERVRIVVCCWFWMGCLCWFMAPWLHEFLDLDADFESAPGAGRQEGPGGKVSFSLLLLLEVYYLLKFETTRG